MNDVAGRSGHKAIPLHGRTASKKMLIRRHRTSGETDNKRRRMVEQNTHDKKIDAMLVGDSRWAFFSLALLWMIYAYVISTVLQYTGVSAISLALLASAAPVLLFNTASILALNRHYRQDKDYIYGLDVHYLKARKMNRLPENGDA